VMTMLNFNLQLHSEEEGSLTENKRTLSHGGRLPIGLVLGSASWDDVSAITGRIQEVMNFGARFCRKVSTRTPMGTRWIGPLVRETVSGQRAALDSKRDENCENGSLTLSGTTLGQGELLLHL